MIGSHFPCLPAKQWAMLWTTWQASLEARLCLVQQTGQLQGFVPKHIIGNPFLKKCCWWPLIKHGIRCAAIAWRRLGALLLERHKLAVAHGK